MLRNAIIRQIEIISEASSLLTPEFKDSHTDIPWSSMSGLRNILIHKYFGVDIEIIKQVVTVDIPKLKTMILLIIDDFESK